MDDILVITSVMGDLAVEEDIKIVREVRIPYLEKKRRRR